MTKPKETTPIHSLVMQCPTHKRGEIFCFISDSIHSLHSCCRVHEARARIDAFLLAKGNVAVPPVASAPAPTQQVQGVSPPSGGEENADGFAIKLQWSGQDYSFSCPEDKTILEAAMDNDLDLPHSCMSGSCLTCPGRIKSGTVDQSDGM